MANSSSEDETDTLPERPTRIQPYQFEPVRQDFERLPEHRVSFEANPMRYSMGEGPVKENGVLSLTLTSKVKIMLNFAKTAEKWLLTRLRFCPD